MQLGKLSDSQGNQRDGCKTAAFGLQSDQRVKSEPQNFGLARCGRPRAEKTPTETVGVLAPAPKELSVYIGRERIGRYLQTDMKKFKAFDAKDRLLGSFRVRARALAAIRKAMRGARS